MCVLIHSEMNDTRIEILPAQIETDHGTEDVLKRLEFDCSSQHSSIPNKSADASITNLKRIRKHLVIGKHIEVIEDKGNKYRCSICKSQFTLKYQIRYHDYCVTGERPLKCDLCEKRFVTKSHLVYHRRTHSGESPYKCSICSKMFKQKNKLNRHEKIHKESGQHEKFTCSVCKKDYSDKDSLKKHSLKHDSSKEVKCTFCSKKYIDQYTLKQHMAIHQRAKYICEVCGRKFHRRNNLNIHMQMHKDIYPQQCLECKKTFRTKKELKQHGVVHDKNNPGFQCSECSVTFGRKDNLLRHIRNCHLDPCQKKELITKKINEESNKLDKDVQLETKSCHNRGHKNSTPVPNDRGGTVETPHDHNKEIMDSPNFEVKKPSVTNNGNNVDPNVVNKENNNYCNVEKIGSVKDTTKFKKPWNTGLNDLPIENVAIDSILVDENLDMKDFQFCEPKNLTIRKNQNLAVLPIDLSHIEGVNSNPHQLSRSHRKTSVIVHTSSLQEQPLVSVLPNICREPVIKFSQASSE